MGKLKVYCPYSALELGWEKIKELPNVTFEKPWYLEYNTDTSVRRLIDDDIVRTILKSIELRNKESSR